MKYRKLSKIDAERFWKMLNQLDYETKYMMYEPGERSRNIAEIEIIIQNAADGKDFLLVAEADDKIVGYIQAQRGDFKRISHSAYIVVGILKDYRGNGIGREFFKQLDSWAEKAKITRLELTVICENEVAKNLYKRNGFEIEGIKRNSILADGKYFDEFYMAKII